MFRYEKTLEYPINVKKKDIKMAKYLITQFGGPIFKWDLQENRKVKLWGIVSFLELEKKEDTFTVLCIKK